MNSDPTTLDGLLDIEPPGTPFLYLLEETPTDIVVSILIFVSLSFIVSRLLWKHYFSIKGRARQKIRKLHAKLMAEKINHHEVACQLSMILRQSLNLNAIIIRTDFPEELETHRQRWDSFTSQLSFACFSSNEKKSEDISILISDAYFWLKLWPMNQRD